VKSREEPGGCKRRIIGRSVRTFSTADSKDNAIFSVYAPAPNDAERRRCGEAQPLALCHSLFGGSSGRGCRFPDAALRTGHSSIGRSRARAGRFGRRESLASRRRRPREFRGSRARTPGRSRGRCAISGLLRCPRGREEGAPEDGEGPPEYGQGGTPLWREGGRLAPQKSSPHRRPEPSRRLGAATPSPESHGG
jgi:hypothetical protein